MKLVASAQSGVAESATGWYGGCVGHAPPEVEPELPLVLLPEVLLALEPVEPLDELEAVDEEELLEIDDAALLELIDELELVLRVELLLAEVVLLVDVEELEPAPLPPVELVDEALLAELEDPAKHAAL